jgi:hypothetical protein
MLDIEHERSSARLRLAAAVIAAVGGGWLAWVDTSIWMRLTALASWMFAARFVAGYRKARRLDPNDAHYLEITPEHLILAQGAQHRTIPFAQLDRIELDEDRIAVVLCLGTGEELTVEPVYGGLGQLELAETLQRYSQGRSKVGCTELNP